MKSTDTTTRRRSAREWARLVEAWEKSGRPLDEFAAKRGVKPRTLSWWRWRFGASKAVALERGHEPLRLVPVHVAPDVRSASSAPLWEVTTVEGHVLRVFGTTAPAELAAVLAALTSTARSGGRR